jgi:hypothetical protein
VQNRPLSKDFVCGVPRPFSSFATSARMITRIFMLYLIAGEVFVALILSFSSRFQLHIKKYTMFQAVMACGYVAATWPNVFRFGSREGRGR